MGRLYISAENQVGGPWLIDHENLETLNVLFNEIDKKLREAIVKHIDYTAKQQMDEEPQTLDYNKRVAKLQRKYNQKNKFAQITFEDGNTYEVDDIEGICNYVDSNTSQVPTELYIRTIHGNHENEFDLIINSAAESGEVDFEYRIKCIDEEIQQKIKTLIDKWIRDNKPSTALSIWSNFIIYMVWFFGVFAIIISAGNISETHSKAGSYKLQLNKDAQKMIENRNVTFNSDEALTLLLKLQSDYVPESIKAETVVVKSVGAFKFFITSSIIFFISLIRPKTIIGIGKKYNRLKLYKFWIKLVYGTVILLAGTLLSDSFLHFINL